MKTISWYRRRLRKWGEMYLINDNKTWSRLCVYLKNIPKILYLVQSNYIKEIRLENNGVYGINHHLRKIEIMQISCNVAGSGTCRTYLLSLASFQITRDFIWNDVLKFYLMKHCILFLENKGDLCRVLFLLFCLWNEFYVYFADR